MWGLLGAALAAIAYGAATILQAMGVRHIAAVPPQASLADRIRAGRLYAAGLGLDGLGFLASVGALRTLPLFLVESAVASSVAVTALLAVLVLDVRLHRAEVVALATTMAGLVLMALSARAGAARHVGPTGGWVLFAACGVVGAMTVAGVRDPQPRRGSVVLATASGLGFGLLGVAARTLHVRTPWWHSAFDPLLWSIVVEGVLASVAYGLALHRGRTTTVAAITFATETVIPALIGIVALGDGVRPGLAPVAVVGFVAAVGGSIALAGHAEGPEPAQVDLHQARR